MATQSVTGRDYIQKKKDNAKKALKSEKEALKEITQDMCMEISNEKIHYTDDLIVPASEKNSNMIFYKIYEVLWQPEKPSYVRDKDLAFSVAISTTENDDKIDYDKEMLQDVKNFINWYVDPKYQKTSEMVQIADAGFYAVNSPYKHEKASTLLGVPLGSSSVPERRGPFQDYPTFFNEYVESDNGQAAEYAKTQFYSNKDGDCNVACSLLSASYSPKLDHEKENTADIETCNTICGVLCRGALVRHEEFGSLIIKQVIGVEGVKPTNSSSWAKRESIGIESHQVVAGTKQNKKENQRNTYTVSEVHLPDYSSGAQAEGIRWYAIAERCIRLQKEALEAKYSNENLQILGLVRDTINFSVYRPSRTLLYATMNAKWEVSRGEPITVQIYYTLGAFIIRHKYTPGQQKNGATPTKQTPPSKKTVWNAKNNDKTTGPLYKALNKLNRLYKPEQNREVLGKNDTVQTVPVRRPPRNATKTVPAVKSKDAATEVPEETHTPKHGKVPVQNETPDDDQEGEWTKVKGKNNKKDKKPPPAPTDQRDETIMDKPGGDDNNSDEDTSDSDNSASDTEEAPKPKRPSGNRFEALNDEDKVKATKAEAGIGHDKTLLAVAAAITKTPSVNISDHANLAAICAQTMNLNLRV
jgi:hypothetical protein